MTIYGRSEELVSRCIECDLAEPESLTSLGGSSPGVVDGILSIRINVQSSFMLLYEAHACTFTNETTCNCLGCFLCYLLLCNSINDFHAPNSNWFTGAYVPHGKGEFIHFLGVTQKVSTTDYVLSKLKI